MTAAAHETIPYDKNIAPAAALMADPTRAAILSALVPDRPLAAGELARLAGVSAATASFHLAKLLDGGLIAVARQGRHRYYRLAGYRVAAAFEALGLVSPTVPVRTLRQSREAVALAEARTCYDHLAGRAGVALLDALLHRGLLRPEKSKQASSRTSTGNTPANRFEVTGAGAAALGSFGIDVAEIRRSRRTFAGECIDWTQRRGHLNGALAAAITARLFALGWVQHGLRRRSVLITPAGTDGLSTTFGWDPTQLPLIPAVTSAPLPAEAALDLAQEGAALGEDAASLADERDVGLRVRVGGQPLPVLLVGGQRIEIDQRDREVVRALLGQVVPGQQAAAALDDGRPGSGVLLEVLDAVRVERVLDGARDHDVSLCPGLVPTVGGQYLSRGRMIGAGLGLAGCRS
jgi:DNA-binding transcriptional ArsR family regulator